MVDTFYASPTRTTPTNLTAEIELINDNPVVTGLLHSVIGLLAVLDENRQIVALNDSLIKILGIADCSEALGLRPGEALHCIHANDSPAGCGTTKYCSTCGAAIAIVSSQEHNGPMERICALTVERNGQQMDLSLSVKSHPVTISKTRFLLLFLQDITQQQQRAALERTFFHDINNLLSMLSGASELLLSKEPSSLAEIIHQAALRLNKEVAVQRCLMDSEFCEYKPSWYAYSVDHILDEISTFFMTHPVAEKKTLEFTTGQIDQTIKTDICLISRILGNMITNALEATEEGSVVKVWAEQEKDGVTFCVWNAQSIPKPIADRIFQRNFSTKGQDGRGVGTFSMKLLGEKILGGKVTFQSTAEDGTLFMFSIG